MYVKDSLYQCMSKSHYTNVCQKIILWYCRKKTVIILSNPLYKYEHTHRCKSDPPPLFAWLIMTRKLFNLLFYYFFPVWWGYSRKRIKSEWIFVILAPVKCERMDSVKILVKWMYVKLMFSFLITDMRIWYSTGLRCWNRKDNLYQKYLSWPLPAWHWYHFIRSDQRSEIWFDHSMYFRYLFHSY